ncbi:Elongation factor 1-gamma Short=EF-1-gamma [Rhizoctonia solani AG-1 IB]|uniref:Elongation factor 1-gamma Short=EF-1-gamma n=1 Tax=Thanatephorus cucumeris (strain AG1-IB / isolate 7/3/14) TaxID=1108050 RepID=M5C1A1_THACB|nr:Elongation factor 1-gamma Short=EF-1-gamma [Rhizoctonia solani AG-1 IB]
MASIGTLHTTDKQPHTKRIRATAAIAGLTLDTAPDYVHGVTNKTPEYKAKFASGKIPGFETKDGFTLFEGSAIARYIASLAPNSGLLGASPTDAALVDQWVSYLDSEILSRASTLWRLLTGEFPYNKSYEAALREKIHESLVVVDTHLTHNTFFLPTNRISLADVTGAVVMDLLCQYVLGPAERAKYPAVIRLLETVANQPKTKDVFGPLNFTDAPLQYVSPKKEKLAAPAAPKAPKEKKPENDDDDDEPLVPAEPKAKNPLDDLPKSTFNLEDWKRAYSNMDTRGAGGSLEWFYEKFDPEGFSIWRVDFKYNEELTQTFMSSNQIGGFFNRLEGSKKYLFGSVGVLGEANNSRISGVFILRGQDSKAVLDAAPDWESYEYKKIDLSNAEDKAFFEAALAWDLEIDGKKWVDGKNFK